MTPVTLWYRQVKQKGGYLEWEFNHLEDGHCPNDVPTPKQPIHEHVWKGKWSKIHAMLDENRHVIQKQETNVQCTPNGAD